MKYIKNMMVIFTALSIFLVSACAKEKIIMEGSTTVLPIAQKVAEEYMKINSHIQVIVKGGGSGVGITSLIDGNCDIADASRSIKTKELENANKKGKGIKTNIIAIDGIVVVVHPLNKIENITKAQIIDIYTGKIKNWKELGGEDKKIVVVSRDSASGTYEAFSELALDKKRVRPDALMQASNQGVFNMVSKTETAIGYIGFGYLRDGVKAVKYDGVEPTKENIVSGKYKLSRPLFMYTLKNPREEVRKLIDFVKSEKGQNIVEEVGYLSIREKK
ncbi:MAG: PstS family phosphate ABC transporter substrate-binding protein [Elusimicrobiota bacterium]